MKHLIAFASGMAIVLLIGCQDTPAPEIQFIDVSRPIPKPEVITITKTITAPCPDCIHCKEKDAKIAEWTAYGDAMKTYLATYTIVGGTETQSNSHTVRSRRRWFTENGR